jgi:hypothetical protein
MQLNSAYGMNLPHILDFYYTIVTKDTSIVQTPVGLRLQGVMDWMV